MLEHINIEKVLFLDIETVPGYKAYGLLPDHLKKLWDRKAGFLSGNDDTSPEVLYQRAGIYAEFGKIICICAGFIREGKLRLKSFYGHDEGALLREFGNMVSGYFDNKDFFLCAHNGKEFDFPFICRRLLVNQLPLPDLFDLAGKKPWEVMHLDTMELWKFGDRKNYTSLDLLTTILDIPSPKQDIDGSDVGRVYWSEDGLDRIVEYCRRDVIAIAQLLLRYKGRKILSEDQIIAS